jgi:hypothetical protein
MCVSTPRRARESRICPTKEQISRVRHRFVAKKGSGTTMKIGCIVYVPLPAMLKPWYQLWRKNPHGKPDVDIPFDDYLVLFMN